jgi:FkbM family methyltransferase
MTDRTRLKRMLSKTRTLLELLTVLDRRQCARMLLDAAAVTVSRTKYVRIPTPGIEGAVNLRRGTSDFAVYKQVFLDRTYDFSFSEPYAAYLRSARHRDCVIIDAGANNGCSAIYFRSRLPDALILAVEPDAENYEVMVANISPFPRVVPLRRALWSCGEHLEARASESAHWSRAFSPSVGGVSTAPSNAVETITMTSLLEYAPERATLIVKMDIEGAEEVVVTAESPWIRRADLILVELHDWMRGAEGRGASVLRAILADDFIVAVRRDVIGFLRRSAIVDRR